MRCVLRSHQHIPVTSHSVKSAISLNGHIVISYTVNDVCPICTGGISSHSTCVTGANIDQLLTLSRKQTATVAWNGFNGQWQWKFYLWLPLVLTIIAVVFYKEQSVMQQTGSHKPKEKFVVLVQVHKAKEKQRLLTVCAVHEVLRSRAVWWPSSCCLANLYTDYKKSTLLSCIQHSIGTKHGHTPAMNSQ